MNRDRLHLVRTSTDAPGSHPVPGEVGLEQESLERLQCRLFKKMSLTKLVAMINMECFPIVRTQPHFTERLV